MRCMNMIQFNTAPFAGVVPFPLFLRQNEDMLLYSKTSRCHCVYGKLRLTHNRNHLIVSM
jgi:hypothetical protein